MIAVDNDDLWTIVMIALVLGLVVGFVSYQYYLSRSE